jgi:hypothetical protein
MSAIADGLGAASARRALELEEGAGFASEGRAWPKDPMNEDQPTCLSQDTSYGSYVSSQESLDDFGAHGRIPSHDFDDGEDDDEDEDGVAFVTRAPALPRPSLGSLVEDAERKASELRQGDIHRAMSERPHLQALVGWLAGADAPASSCSPCWRLRSLPAPAHLALPAVAHAQSLAPPGLEMEPITVGGMASYPFLGGEDDDKDEDGAAVVTRAPVLCHLSLGSSLHAAGTCKPCTWYWKPGGCKNGQDCRHCHLCPPGEEASQRRRVVALRRGPRRGAAARLAPGGAGAA